MKTIAIGILCLALAACTKTPEEYVKLVDNCRKLGFKSSVERVDKFGNVIGVYCVTDKGNKVSY